MADKWGTAGAGALGGAGTGAAIGSAFGPIGTAVGAGIGGIGGFFSGLSSGQGVEDATAAQQAAMDQAMRQLQQYSQDSYKRRISDLQNTLAFYGPADNYLRSIYGGPPRNPPKSPLQTPQTGAWDKPDPRFAAAAWQPGGGVVGPDGKLIGPPPGTPQGQWAPIPGAGPAPAPPPQQMLPQRPGANGLPPLSAFGIR